ncbi:MAG: hypothetical protein U0183_20135 [Polyangiaceae bacterium]
MTVLIAWTRSLGTYEELLFCSDSRNRGDGRVFDYCPKLMLLPRSDCVVGYAGYTGNAYPLMLQLANAISAFEPARERIMDVGKLVTHLLKVLDAVVSSISDAVPIMQFPTDFQLLFGGYSWIEKRFRIWKIVYEVRNRRFVAHSARFPALPLHTGAALRWSGVAMPDSIGQVAFAGDKAQAAKRALSSLVGDGSSCRHDRAGRAQLDLEPFMVVRDLLLGAHVHDTIGGPPQVVKVYAHHNAAPVAVWWPSSGRDPSTVRRFLLGRPLLDYEQYGPWALDPYSFRVSHAAYSDSSDGAVSLNFARGLLVRKVCTRL